MLSFSPCSCTWFKESDREQILLARLLGQARRDVEGSRKPGWSHHTEQAAQEPGLWWVTVKSLQTSVTTASQCILATQYGFPTLSLTREFVIWWVPVRSLKTFVKTVSQWILDTQHGFPTLILNLTLNLSLTLHAVWIPNPNSNYNPNLKPPCSMHSQPLTLTLTLHIVWIPNQ